MKICEATAVQRRSGLTLIEVLATVFVLGMGLIMVGAAFPVGIDQMRRTKEDTNAAELARSAFNMLRAEGFAQSATNATPGSGFTTMADMSLTPGTYPNGLACCDPSSSAAATWGPYFVSNPNALAYGGSSAYLYWDSNVISNGIIANNTLVCIPVLTRMVQPATATTAPVRIEGAGVPLFRVTLVVVKKTSQAEIGSNGAATGNVLPLWTRANATTTAVTTPNSITLAAGEGWSNVHADDGVLVSYAKVSEVATGLQSDYRTGYVYRVVDEPAQGNVTLDGNPGTLSSTDCLVFYNFVAAYYAYIGG